MTSNLFLTLFAFPAFLLIVLVLLLILARIQKPVEFKAMIDDIRGKFWRK